MSDYFKPIPEIQPWTEDYWKATKRHKLLIQHCESCGVNIFYPRKYCPECWSGDLGWIEANGKAKIYSFSVMMDMVEPKFMADLPYVLAMVNLEEGVRMTTRIVECRPEDVAIGMEVEVVFEDISPECALPMFRPVNPALSPARPSNDEQTAEVSKQTVVMGPETYQTIRYEVGGNNGSVCRITLNRPGKLNSINRVMAEELIDAFKRVKQESSVGVVVLTGAGEKAFCTGGDLDIFPSLVEHESALDWLAHSGLDVQRAITGCEKVVIGEINGHCLAGGLELALCCDLLYAKESAQIGFTEINMGILPGWGGTARIVRSMPVFRARELLYSGSKNYTAREVYEMGLLTRVFKDDEFEEQCNRMVQKIASKKPNALRIAKEIMDKSTDGSDIETALAVERNGIQWLSSAPDVQETLAQFRTAGK